MLKYRGNCNKLIPNEIVYIFSLGGFLFLSIILLLITCARSPQQVNDAELYDMEMGVESTIKRKKWGTTDEKLRAQFTEEYKTYKNKRQVFEKYLDTLGACSTH